MGISGLLPLLKSITRRVHLEQLAGQSVAIDAYSWLHKGIYGSCAVDLFHGRRNDSFVEFCMSKIRMMMNFNVRPILVFDGCHLPMKSSQEILRRRVRGESREKAIELIKSRAHSDAYVHIQKCADVTPQMAASLIRELKKWGIEFIVAPFEADAQMAWLQKVGKVAAVVTEDSDLLLFGCERVLFKMDRDGWCDEICPERLAQATELDFSRFTLTKFRHMCMLSGCDYLPSIKGMGLKTAYKYVCKYQDVNRLFAALRAEFGTKMSETYDQDFIKADMTFLHQRVYDPNLKRVIFMNPIPTTVDPVIVEEWEFLGRRYPEDIFRGICEGDLCPATLEPLHTPENGDLSETISLSSSQPSQVPNFIIDEDVNAALPFTLSIDRKPLQAGPVQQRISSSQPTRHSNIAVARISLKRSYSVSMVGENKKPYSNTPRGSEIRHKIPLEMTSTNLIYGTRNLRQTLELSPKYTRASSGKTNVVDNQKSIKEFFAKKRIP